MQGPEILTLSEAVHKYIHPGTHILFGGFTLLRRPMALAREIVRQGIGELFVTMNGGTVVEEMLAGAGLIRWLESTYLGLEGGMPVAYGVRLAIESGEIELVEDYSNWSFALRTVAGRYGLPFMPCLGDLGSDLLEYDSFGRAGLREREKDGSWKHPGIPPLKYAVIDDPFSGWGLHPRQYRNGPDTCANRTNSYFQPACGRGPEDNRTWPTAYTGRPGVKVALVPPLLPEVSVIHAQRVALDGTVRLEGLPGPDIDQAVCARVLIVTCERICRPEELRRTPEQNQIAPHNVTAIVEQPFGAYPTAVPNYYDYDYAWFQNYTRQVQHRSMEAVRGFWRRHVAGTANEWAYLEQQVGRERLLSLIADADYHYRPDPERRDGGK